MFDNILTCKWKYGQDKDGVQNGASEIKNYIQSKFQNFDFRNYVDMRETKSDDTNESYHEKVYLLHKQCVGNTLCIGGDHSVAIGSVLSSLEKSNDSTCVIWIDAHPDIHTLTTSSSANIHGMPLSFITGIEKSWFWTQKLKKLEFKNLFYFGIRDIDEFEEEVIKQEKIRVLKNINDICTICHKYENIHISFDVDSLDPSYMHSTGTQCESGIEITEILCLFNYLKKNICWNEKTINLDIVEYNPQIGSEIQKNISKISIEKIVDSLF